jgi:hypothetical protein
MPAILQTQPFRPKYNFDAMRHGDAIEVENTNAAREMFARWKRKTGRSGRLVTSRDFPNRLFFLDDSDLV